MKNALLALIVFAIALPTFAQRRPGPNHGRGPHGPVVVRPIPHPGPRPMPYPVPRPAPTRSCQVVMTDRVNRVVQRYHSWTDFNGMCREGLRQCNYDLQRMGGWGYRCATVRW